MSALRKDLLERRLWPLAALLIAALVAVPVLLLTNSSASGAGTSSPPHVALPGLPVTTTANGSSTAPASAAGAPRDPFAASTPKLSATPAAPLDASTGASSASATTSAATSSPAASTTATTATPTLATTTVTPTSTTATSRTPANTSTVATTGSSGSTASAASSAKSATNVQAQANPQSWTIYAVDLRVGASATAPIRHDVARLTPLPSSTQPELLFMGVLTGGRQAVFALGADVRQQGPGVCRPHRQVCSMILLSPGQTAQLTIPTSAGGQQHLILRLVAVRSSVTHSQSAAIAAYARHSAAGQCDLALAEPMAYSQSAGTLSGAAGAACKGQTAAIPFPSAPASQ